MLLGEIDQVRRVLVGALTERRAGRQPAGVPAHDLDDLDRVEAAHRLCVQARFQDRDRQVASDAAIARAMVRERQVIVDGLGQADDEQLVAALLSQALESGRSVG